MPVHLCAAVVLLVAVQLEEVCVECGVQLPRSPPPTRRQLEVAVAGLVALARGSRGSITPTARNTQHLLAPPAAPTANEPDHQDASSTTVTATIDASTTANTIVEEMRMSSTVSTAAVAAMHALQGPPAASAPFSHPSHLPLVVRQVELQPDGPTSSSDSELQRSAAIAADAAAAATLATSPNRDEARRSALAGASQAMWSVLAAPEQVGPGVLVVL
jgi:hypothetical protein